jgi:acyl-CoA synthetase (NDP forming)
MDSNDDATSYLSVQIALPGGDFVVLATDLNVVLGRGLAPRAVAVYGASARRPGSQAARIAGKLLATGYGGRVALVNPNPQEVHGVATVPSASLSPLASELDLAVISVPRESVVSAVEDCAAAGVRLAVVTSAQFAEADARGAELQRQLAERAAALGVRLIGPNCMGLINFSQGLVAAGRELPARPGKISVVAQSGYLSIRMMDYIRETGQGIDLWVTMGNSADLTPADMIEYLGSRSETGVVVVYLENIPDPRRLSSALQAARAAGTDVVVLKSGRTALGSQVAASHTGALASPDVFVDVLVSEADCIRVDTVREAAQVASLIAAFGGRPAGPFVVTSGSGGDCVLAADWCAKQNIPLASLSAPTIDKIQQIVPEAEAGKDNPIDISPFPFDGSNRQMEVLATMAADPGVGGIVLMDGWGWDSEETPAGRTLKLTPLAAPGSRVPLPVIADSRMEEWQRDALVTAGFAVTSDGETIWRSLGHIARQARAAGTLPGRDAPGRDAHGGPGRGLPAPERLPELDAFGRLRAAGIPMIETEPVRTPEELLAAGRRLGYPLVVKGLVPGVVHKADAQLVYTDVWGDDEALAAWKRLADTMTGQAGRIVVQPQVRGALAEIIVATRDDPHYGLHVMVGAGGKWVEADSDVAWATAPVTAAQAERMLRRTKIGRALAAKQPRLLQEQALPGVVAAVSAVAAQWLDSAAEIEINPLIVRADSVVAVDAVVTLRGAAK